MSELRNLALLFTLLFSLTLQADNPFPTLGNGEEIIDDWADHHSASSDSEEADAAGTLGESNDDDPFGSCDLTEEDLAPSDQDREAAERQLTQIVAQCRQPFEGSIFDLDRDERFTAVALGVNYNNASLESLRSALTTTRAHIQDLEPEFDRIYIRADLRGACRRCVDASNAQFAQKTDELREQLRTHLRFDYRCSEANGRTPASDESLETDPRTKRQVICTETEQEWLAGAGADNEFIGEHIGQARKDLRAQAKETVVLRMWKQHAPTMELPQWRRTIQTREWGWEFERQLQAEYPIWGVEPPLCECIINHDELPFKKCRALERILGDAISVRE